MTKKERIKYWNKHRTTYLPRCEFCKRDEYEKVLYKPEGGVFGHTYCKKCFIGEENE